MKNVSSRNFGGFTLMELLIVVLIIGMLTAFAVPKYTELIWKARAANLQALTDRIGKSHQRYYDDNYECAPSFDSLDLGIDGSLSQGASGTMVMVDETVSAVEGRGNDDFEILILSHHRQGCWTVGRFKKGPWAKSGFAVIHSTNYAQLKGSLGKNLCIAEDYYTKSKFCERYLATEEEPFYRHVHNKFYHM